MADRIIATTINPSSATISKGAPRRAREEEELTPSELAPGPAPRRPQGDHHQSQSREEEEDEERNHLQRARRIRHAPRICCGPSCRTVHVHRPVGKARPYTSAIHSSLSLTSLKFSPVLLSIFRRIWEKEEETKGEGMETWQRRGGG